MLLDVWWWLDKPDRFALLVLSGAEASGAEGKTCQVWLGYNAPLCIRGAV